jgi:hypothetical protein
LRIAKSANGEKKKKQDTEHSIKNLEDSKHKNQNHNKIHSTRGGRKAAKNPKS